MIATVVAGWFFVRTSYAQTEPIGYQWVAFSVLFVFCLLQIQVGLLLRSAFYVNLAMTFIVLR